MRIGYLFRGRKISRKIQIREYSENVLHAKNTCYTVPVVFIIRLQEIRKPRMKWRKTIKWSKCKGNGSNKQGAGEEEMRVDQYRSRRRGGGVDHTKKRLWEQKKCMAEHRSKAECSITRSDGLATLQT